MKKVLTIVAIAGAVAAFTASSAAASNGYLTPIAMTMIYKVKPAYAHIVKRVARRQDSSAVCGYTFHRRAYGCTVELDGALVTYVATRPSMCVYRLWAVMHHRIIIRKRVNMC